MHKLDKTVGEFYKSRISLQNEETAKCLVSSKYYILHVLSVAIIMSLPRNNI